MQESKFDGGFFQWLGWTILGSLLSTITLGICVPWAVCMIKRWEVRHTIIDGKRLTFDGHGGQLFGNYIKWLLLTIITLGIYSLWIPIKMKNWVTKHSHVA